MNKFNKEIAQALLENINLTEVFCNQLESTMNNFLENKLTAILRYNPYARLNNRNYRNGDYTRRLDTWLGQINVRVPMERKGEFHQSLISPYIRRIDNLETTIIHLYEKTLSLKKLLI